MNFLPISINIDNKPILIVGGGKVAYHKIVLLQRFTNKIKVVAREVSDAIKKLDIEFVEKPYEPADLHGFILVYAATNVHELNLQIRHDGHAAGVLVNVVDNPANCDFVSPAIYRKGNMTVAVSSNGEDVYKSIAWRDTIRDVFERGYLRAWFKKTFSKEKPVCVKKPKPRCKSGTVYLVGFGPGDPELMTIKAHRILHEADIIFFDDLIDSSILSSYSARKVYVGKRRDNHHKSQDEINALLKDAALLNKIVVRLKGGDPLIFGRGIEEQKYLQTFGIAVEIVPGITAGIAAGSLAGIPLTQRGVSSSVAIGTAHAKNSFKILDADTSVYYMGNQNLSDIAKQYLDKGYAPDFPVAVVYNVSLPDQETTISTIGELAQNKYSFRSPIISIFGNSVNERVGKE